MTEELEERRVEALEDIAGAVTAVFYALCAFTGLTVGAIIGVGIAVSA